MLGIFDDLLEKGVIQLLELKRPKDVQRTTNPKYCHYHRMVSHPLEKCITLKERIMQLVEDGVIILNLDNELRQITFYAKQGDCLVFNLEV